MTLADFLLARIAEDEAWARAAVETPGATHWQWVNPETDIPVAPDPFVEDYLDDGASVSLRSVEELKLTSWGPPLPDFAIHSSDEMKVGVAGHIVRHDPARVLAECEAKRRIVGMCSPSGEDEDGAPFYVGGYGEAYVETLAYLALPYADHPDYREEWKP